VAIRDELDNQGVQMAGNTTAARFDRYLGAYFAQTERARDEIDQALLVDAANPLLNIYRSVANIRLGQLDAARQDADAAERLGPAGWTSPLYLSGFSAYITGDLTGSLDLFSQIMAARPDDWFPVNYRGALHYLRGEYPAARDDLQRAIELGPNANFPYVFATMLALRAGQIDEAKALIATTVATYPDPTLANRTINGLFGPDTPNLFGPTFSAFGNLGLGRYTAVLSDTAAALEIAPELVDLHFMQGYAYCNLGQYAEAEAAYARALELDPGFTMLYLLRAEARQRQQNLPGALADIAAVQSSPQAAQFVPLVAQAQAGQLSCETFFK
jgi:tetratricopeptide (TPR) repeat protein